MNPALHIQMHFRDQMRRHFYSRAGSELFNISCWTAWDETQTFWSAVGVPYLERICYSQISKAYYGRSR